MGKELYVTIKYNVLGSVDAKKLITGADEGDLRIIAALFMLSGADGGTAVSAKSLCELLGADMSDVKGSLKFWRGAGIVECGEKAERIEDHSAADAACKNTEKIKTAHKNGVIQQSSTLEQYSSAELADIMEKKVVSACLIEEAERIYGKIFRTYDTSILVGIVDRLGFDEEAVLTILHYTVNVKGKKTLRYAETLAMQLYDEGITETADVMARIEKMENSEAVISKIRAMYGMGDRALTTTEKKHFGKWTETFGYDMDVIRMAYDITVDNTQKPTPRYTNGILERWYADGVRTAEDAKRYLEKQSGGEAKLGKSFDADDFFEAALRRSYEDMN